MGIKGSLAGTALRKSFSQFAKVKVQEQLRAVGVETLDANGNLRKMAEIMRDIAKVMQTMPTAEKLAFAEDIFDIRGSLAGLTLTANTDELDAMLAKLMDVEGVAADTAQKMDAGLGGSFRLLMSAVEGAMNAIAAAMNSTLQPFIKKVTDVINVFTQWIEQHQGLVAAFAVVVAGAATLGVALVAIGVIAKGVSAGITVMQTVMKGFAFVQGMCIAQATALKSSFLLIGQAFVDYRNMAIPAMVGTEKFCAALGLASTAANRARASIILMSNAEAAAAVKAAIAEKWRAMTSALSAFRNSAIAATVATKAQTAAELALGAKTAVVNGWLAMTAALKSLTFASLKAAIALRAQVVVESAMTAGRSIAAAWSAMTTALSGLTLATISATVATKAHAAAEAICIASTTALNAVRNAGIVIVAAFTAANLKATIAVGAVAAGNFLLAAAAKIAAGAMIALSAVMTFIAAHPVAMALIALTAILGGVCYALKRAANYTAKLSDQASKLREKGDQLRKTDEVRMVRLQQLAQKQRLTNAEMAEARVLAGKLQNKYGDLGITLTRNSSAITALKTACDRLKDVEVRIIAESDIPKMKKLKVLSLEAHLDVAQQNEAEVMIQELESRYGTLGIEVDRAKGKISALSDSALRLKAVKVQLKTELTEADLKKISRLQQLSMQLDLSVQNQDEAERLISDLQSRYGDLGITVNRTTGKIEKLNTVAGAVSDIKLRIRNAEDLARLSRLEQLSMETSLSVEGQEEAKSLIAYLQQRYGDLGMEVDKVSQKITALNSASAQIGTVSLQLAGMEDLSKLERLRELSCKVTLETSELTEAETLLNFLQGRYRDLGMRIDRTQSRVLDLNASASSLPGVALRVQGEDDFETLRSLMLLVSRTKLTPPDLKNGEKLIADLESSYGKLAVTADHTQGRIVALNETAFRIKAVRFKLKSDIEKPDIPKFEELQTLSLRAQLDDKALERAEDLIRDLEAQYGKLGVEIDRTNGKIARTANAPSQIIELGFRFNNQEDIEKLSRLKDLTLKAELSVEEQGDAAALIANLEQRYGSLGLQVDTVSKRITRLNNTADSLEAVELKVRGGEELAQLQRLKALSLEVSLDVAQQNEAEQLIETLSKRYGELGVVLDKTAKRIKRVHTVASGLKNIAIKVQGTQDVDKLERLKTLSSLPQLDGSGMSEAKALIKELSAKYGDIGLSVDSVGKKIVAVTEKQRQFTEAASVIRYGNDPQKEVHLAQLARLQKLAEQERLTAAEQQEAQSIINTLNGAYNGLGISLDSIAGKLQVAADAQEQLNDKMKQAALAELDGEIAEFKANIRELQAENEALGSYWNQNLWSQVSGRMDESIKQQQANVDKIIALRQKITAAQKRKQAIREDKAGATTGGKPQGSGSTESRVAAEKKLRQQVADEAASAAKRVSDIERQLQRERQSELQNEIQDITELRDEYKKLVQTMLAFEKSKPSAEQDKKKIAELEAKLLEADRTANERIAAAQTKAAQKLKEDVNSYRERFEDSRREISARRAEEAQDRDIDQTLADDKSAGVTKLQSLIERYKKVAREAQIQFNAELQTAQQDGQIDSTERKRIEGAHEAYTKAESLLDKYLGKLRSIQTGTQEIAAKQAAPRGAFLTAALESLSVEGSAATRTAKATELIAANTKKTNDYLRKRTTGLGVFT